MEVNATLNCPCGSSKLFSTCCVLIHENVRKALTAEELMRSRYSAFAIGNGEYLFHSHHSSTRRIEEKLEIETWAKSVKWIKLDVMQTKNGGQNDETGYVEFKAYFLEKGKVNIIHGKSEFEKENGHWTYVTG